MRDATAIVFDFDGVLVESVDIKSRAFATLYEEHGPDVVERVVAHNLAFGSMSRFEKIRHYQEVFLGRPATPESVRALADRFGSLVEDAVVAAPWVEGAHALLQAYVGLVPMFVLSGTPEVELRRIVPRRGMDGFFDEVRGSPEKKPAVLRDLVNRFALTPERTVMVGDSLGDYEAAHETGLRFIGRVPKGHANPFPADIRTVVDLTALLPAAG